MDFDMWINRPSDLMEQIKDAEEYAERKRAKCERMTINYDEEYVQTTRFDSVTKNILELDEARKVVGRLYDQYFDTIEEIREFMYTNLPSRQADILDWRYCHLFSVERIAEKKDMTLSGVYGSCRKALTNLRKAYTEKNGK